MAVNSVWLSAISPDLATGIEPVSSQVSTEIVRKYLPDQAPFRALLPGMEGQPDDCNEPVAQYCNDCGTSFWVSKSCNQRGCPVCYSKWAWVEAGKASRRIWTKRANLRERFIYPRILHVVVSLRYDGESFSQLKEFVRKVLRAHGSDGELMIYHQWRESENAWLFDGTVHFHAVIIALGDVLPAISGEHLPYLDSKTGIWHLCVENQPNDVQKVVFKVVENPFGKPFGGVKKLHDLRVLIAYQLSHCSILPDKHTVVWSGSISYTKWKSSDVDEYPAPPLVGRVCPNCQSTNTEPCDVRHSYDAYGSHPYPSYDLLPVLRRVVIEWANSHGGG